MFTLSEQTISPQYLDTIARGTLTPENFATCLQKELQEVMANGVLEREMVLVIFRCYWGRYQEEIRNRFEHYEFKGVMAAQQLATFADILLRSIVEVSVKLCPDVQLSEGSGFAIVAVGGYGRGLLAPFSDIDLLFLVADDVLNRVAPCVECILYFLWDLSFTVGHAIRTVKECIAKAKEDTTIRTALLDARFLVGDPVLFADFENHYTRSCIEVGALDFVRDKQHDRLKRHRRFGSSPYFVEPNLKEGRGGLRDLQTLYWICCNTFGLCHSRDSLASKFISMGLLTERETQRVFRSWDFLWTVRLHLHYVTGRAEERLTFDVQPIIGARMGYVYHGRQKGVERFMRHYFLTVREIMRLTHVLEPIVIRQLQDATTQVEEKPDQAMRDAGFILLDGQILPDKGVSFERDPIKMLQILYWAQRCRYPLHPFARHQIIRAEHKAIALRNNPEANRIFFELLCGQSLGETSHSPNISPCISLHNSGLSAKEHQSDEQYLGDDESVSLGHAYWLRILNETGILGRFIPEWSRIVGQMQFDTYHVFTVDEHTIEAIRILDEIMAGRMADEISIVYGIAKNLYSYRELYVAVLLHDIAKGRGGDHSEIGEDIATKICQQLGMTEGETETVSWLVLHHLLLSHVAFQRDLEDPKTIFDVVKSVQSLERLRLLLLLTIADIRAVNKHVWSAWKATLLRNLYERIAAVLSGGFLIKNNDDRVQYVKRTITTDLLKEGFGQKEIDRYTDTFYQEYWLAFDEETLCRYARLLRKREQSYSPYVIDVTPISASNMVEVVVYMDNVMGSFSKIVGALALADFSVIEASIYRTNRNSVLDIFWVKNINGDTFYNESCQARITKSIQNVFNHEVDVDAKIKSKGFGYVPSRLRSIYVSSGVMIDNVASDHATLIEITGRDVPGFLYYMTDFIRQEKLRILSTHVTTYGVRAVDVFYVQNMCGLKITDHEQLERLRRNILLRLKEVCERL